MTEQAVADNSAQNTQISIGAAAIQVVAVVFNENGGQTEYHYFAPKEARTGQYAVVYSEARGSEFPFKIVRIVRDNVIDLGGKATKSIWGSFDENFAKQVQLRTEHLQRVKSQLQMKKQQFEETQMFAMMAQTDPEVAKLLEELKGF